MCGKEKEKLNADTTIFLTSNIGSKQLNRYILPLADVEWLVEDKHNELELSVDSKDVVHSKGDVLISFTPDPTCTCAEDWVQLGQQRVMFYLFNAVKMNTKNLRFYCDKIEVNYLVPERGMGVKNAHPELVF